MQGLIDVDAEQARLNRQREKVQIDLDRSRGKLNNENFVNNAPTEVVTTESRRADEFEQQLAQLDEQLERLQGLQQESPP